MNIMQREVLPVWGKGRHKGKVNWKESIGCFVPFEYNGIKGEVEILDKKDRNVLVRYKNRSEWITESSFNKCEISYVLGIKNKGFKYLDGEVVTTKNGNKIKILESFYRERISGERVKKDKCIKYKCLTCGNTDEVLENLVERDNSNVCNVCCYPTKKVLKGYNDIATTHPHLIKYFENKEEAYVNTFGSDKTVVLKCPYCGNKQKYLLSNITSKYKMGFNCKICGDTTSYPERFITSLLTVKGVEFTPQLSRSTFEWCGNYLYDFYLPYYNMIIETHGAQHYEENSYFRTSLNEVQENDKCKEALAKGNGIENYVVIDCRYSNGKFILNNVAEILKNKLNLNITEKEYLMIQEKTMTSQVREICDYKGFRSDITLSDIARKFNKGKTYIKHCIDIGIELGICNYSIKDSRNISAKKRGELRRGISNEKAKVPVRCNELNMNFDSRVECIKYFKEILNLNLDSGSLTKLCNGKLKKFKGFYTFQNI